MITINLLPAQLRKSEMSFDIPFLPIIVRSILGIVGLMILLGVIGVLQQSRAALLEREWNGMDKQFQEVTGVKDTLREKEQSAKVLQSILEQDMSWTTLLNKTNKAVPNGLWINRFSLSERGLVLEGSVFSFSTDEVTLINKFYNQLKDDAFFQRHFDDFSLDSVQRRTIKNYELFDFLLTAKIRPRAQPPRPKQKATRAKKAKKRKGKRGSRH